MDQTAAMEGFEQMMFRVETLIQKEPPAICLLLK